MPKKPKANSRVNIKYEVETNGSPEQIELPFVIGVTADLSGDRDPNDAAPDPNKPDKKIPTVFSSLEETKRGRERTFEEFTHDNFDRKMAAISPRVELQVPNLLDKSQPGTSLPVELRFKSMDDFSPGAIARNVPPLKNLLDARNRLKELLVILNTRPDLADNVLALLKDPDKLKEIASGAAKL
jgi:type VI secretion system protein ImpB